MKRSNAQVDARADPNSQGNHVIRVRVYYEDTDAGGVVYYANYLKFAERARTEMLRLAGVDHRDLLENDGVLLAVRSCDAEYLRPAVLDDALEVHSVIVESRGASLRLEQTICRDGVALTRLKLRIACIARDGRPARLPDRVIFALKPFGNFPSTISRQLQQRV